MDFSSRIAGRGLTFDLYLNSALAGQEVELGRARIIGEIYVPSLLHEMGCDADLIGKRPETVWTAHGIAQPSFERRFDGGRQCLVNSVSGD